VLWLIANAIHPLILVPAYNIDQTYLFKVAITES